MRGNWAAGVGEVSSLRDAFRRHKRLRGAGERKGAALCLHLIVGVSAEAMQGDVHDPANVSGRRLVQAAVGWAEREFGEGSVFAIRRDLDEEGASICDVFVAPVRMMRAGRGKPKPRISTGRALEEIARRTGHPVGKSYRGLQDTWAKAATAVNPAVQRGRPLAETGAEHVHQDVIRKHHVAAERDAEATRAAAAAESEATREEARVAAKIIRAQADAAGRAAMAKAQADAGAVVRQARRIAVKCGALALGKSSPPSGGK